MTFLSQMHCSECSCNFAMEKCLEDAARKNPAITFYCPNGHPQHFPLEPTEADTLRRERNSLLQQQARLNDIIRAEREYKEAAQRSAAAARGQVTRLKNRASAGLCPCCNRSFVNLHRHMTTKHPQFAHDAATETGDGR